MATEYGLMVTLISVLVGGLVAAFGAHLIPDPCTLFQVCSPAEPRRGLDPAGGPRAPGRRPTTRPCRLRRR